MGQMGKVFDLYGVLAGTMEEARSMVERAIQQQLHQHESGFRGGAYFRSHDVGREHFILQRNYDEVEREWFEQDDLGAPFILYVNETKRSSELRSALTTNPNIRLLRHDEVTR